jgi:hypothetical protein
MMFQENLMHNLIINMAEQANLLISLKASNKNI